eukprot:TRINITY_DN47967_c0_g1_i1.p1 TRINITY_DN47967_c0_g1~~TRINITY_DN47967_c0_g1_i1.p1  ORF type:complete len:237 (+),score=44.70 TRINITY_DN47967_c0_g1_i1:28-711(+)
MGASLTSSVLNDCTALAASDGLLPCQEAAGQRSERLEAMMQELFRLHDLNANGTLEEVELVKLNEKIAILHCGADADRALVRNRFSTIFRAELDPEGQPVPYSRFRRYMFRMLDAVDPDEPTQAMIMDQFIAEADLAIASFPKSLKARPGFLGALPVPLPQPPQVRGASMGPSGNILPPPPPPMPRTNREDVSGQLWMHQDHLAAPGPCCRASRVLGAPTSIEVCTY